LFPCSFSLVQIMFPPLQFFLLVTGFIFLLGEIWPGVSGREGQQFLCLLGPDFPGPCLLLSVLGDVTRLPLSETPYDSVFSCSLSVRLAGVCKHLFGPFPPLPPSRPQICVLSWPCTCVPAVTSPLAGSAYPVVLCSVDCFSCFVTVTSETRLWFPSAQFLFF